jgi:hypothetical protein
MQNSNLNTGNQATELRELSLDEAEMVGGGFSWGGLVHGAENLAKTAINNIKSHDWNEVWNDAKNGATAGGAVGAFFGVPELGLVTGLAGADYALARQDHLIG